MTNTIRNTPISCPRCRGMVAGKETPRVMENKIVTECQWRCSRCGTFIKHGITKITEK